ncbi:hypothetical protein [Pandoraea sp. PE-S2R-1]|uniref:hypothetical protein n=1 Tax=Pandoraea sp. PE-S2R-1 TaxID=1986994 RepID=UPI000B3FDED9|nr:hypothetical protein [Pandoraea sp. PE-S2R-1]
MVTLAAAGMAASCDHAPRTAGAVTVFKVDVTGISDIAEFADITGIVVTASLCRALRQRTTGDIFGARHECRSGGRRARRGAFGP